MTGWFVLLACPLSVSTTVLIPASVECLHCHLQSSNTDIQSSRTRAPFMALSGLGIAWTGPEHDMGPAHSGAHWLTGIKVWGNADKGPGLSDAAA